MKRKGALLANIAIGVVVLILSLQGWARSRMVGTIQKLEPSQVERLVVFDRDWPSGEARNVSDAETVGALIACLKSGAAYAANHDQQNGFQRVIFIEPNLLKIKVYQKTGDTESVIVELGKWTSETSYVHYGYLRCPADPFWMQL
jgi:hypothetical protein